ncbi:MAG TPA: hypothetical protein VFY17_00060, partial [Pilimelia sp.]|nr:hypothetical protein [Pilimelia sp.]
MPAGEEQAPSPRDSRKPHQGARDTGLDPSAAGDTAHRAGAEAEAAVAGGPEAPASSGPEDPFQRFAPPPPRPPGR